MCRQFDPVRRQLLLFPCLALHDRMSLALFFFVIFVPFIFSFVIAFVIFYKRIVSFSALLTLSLFSLSSLLLASCVQVLASPLSSLQGVSPIFASIFRAYVYSSLIEESSKIFIFYLFAKCLLNRFLLTKRNNNTRENYIKDCSVVSKNNARGSVLLIMFFAASFAGFENIAYIAIEPNIWSYRLFNASMLHILLSPIYVGIFNDRIRSFVYSIVIATILHGSYNFVACNVGALYSYIIIGLLLIKNIFYFSRHWQSILLHEI